MTSSQSLQNRRHPLLLQPVPMLALRWLQSNLSARKLKVSLGEDLAVVILNMRARESGENVQDTPSLWSLLP